MRHLWRGPRFAGVSHAEEVPEQVDAPNSDSVNLNNCGLPSNVSNVPLNNETEVIDSNCNSGNASDISESEIVNKSSNVNNVSSDNNGVAISKDNGKSECNVSSDNNEVAISKDNGKSESNVSKMIIESSDSDSESEDGEIRSDASIGGPSGDELSLDSVRSTDRDGFVMPLPVRRSAQKPRCCIPWAAAFCLAS